jgi:hypothetical protein
MISRILLASVASIALTAVASAQAMDEGSAIHVTSKGRSHVVKVSKATGDKLVKMGHEIPRGAVIYRSGGKTYLIENKAGTAGAKTMLEEQTPDLEPDSSEY